MKKILIIICMIILAGCETFTSPRYSIEADNTMALRQIPEGDISVGPISEPDKFDNACRGAGPINPPDGVTFAAYIREALADELKIAGLFDQDQSPRIIISGKVEELSFSSTRGEWNISLTLNSSNGATMTASEHYEFESGFTATTACQQTAEAFMGAVQNLIGKIVSSDEFQKLVI